MKNSTAATAIKPELVNSMVAICSPAVITDWSAVCTTFRNCGNCVAVTVLMICKSPPGATAGHIAFASETTLFQPNNPPRFRKDASELDDAVGISAHELPVALTFKSDSIGVAAAVGSVKMISPEAIRLPLAVAVEKGIELKLSTHTWINWTTFGGQNIPCQ